MFIKNSCKQKSKERAKAPGCFWTGVGVHYRTVGMFRNGR